MIWARMIIEGMMVTLFLCGTVMELWNRDAKVASAAAIFAAINGFLLVSDICCLP